MTKKLLAFLIAFFAIASAQAQTNNFNILDKAFYPTTYGTAGQCWVSGGNGVIPSWASCGGGAAGSIVVGTTQVTNGGTTRILFESAGLLADSANLLFDSTNARAQIGSGSTTTQGWIIGNNFGTSGQSILMATNVASPTNLKFSLRSLGTNEVNINVGVGSAFKLYTGDTTSLKWQQDDAAGKGPVFTGGTAVAAGIPALQVTRTNNNALVDTGVQFVFTDQTSAAGFLPFQILGTSTGAVNLFNVNKTGIVTLSTAGTIKGGTTALTLDNTSSGTLTFGSNAVTPASTGVRFLCISTAGVVSSSASACVGT